MKEIRLHGRGGQGAVSAADIIAMAAIIDGMYGASLPMFGAERRGAPVVSFACFDNRPIRKKSQLYCPDCLIVLDPRQRRWPQIYEGVKEGGVLILNHDREPETQPHPNIRLSCTIDATRIAREEIGMPAFNTCMLGAFVAATGWISLGAMLSAVEANFSGELINKNVRSVERGYREAKMREW